MGFRVGINCFDTRLQADDYLLSALPPTITAEATQIGRRRVGKECRSRWSPYH